MERNTLKAELLVPRCLVKCQLLVIQATQRHGNIYTSGSFGCLVLSGDKNCLFAAEYDELDLENIKMKGIVASSSL